MGLFPFLVVSNYSSGIDFAQSLLKMAIYSANLFSLLYFDHKKQDYGWI